MKYPDIDPIALSIFGQINIHWYALTYLAAFFLCWRIMKATRGQVIVRGPTSKSRICYLLWWASFWVGASAMSCFTDLMPLSIIHSCCSGFGKEGCLSMEDCSASLSRCGCMPTGQGADFPVTDFVV